MDGSRFDGLARGLATGTTRRRAFVRLSGGIVAVLLGQIGLEAAAAACVRPGRKGCEGPRNKRCCRGARCQGGNRRKAGRCRCRGNLTQCGRACVHTGTDPRHCGGCTQRCGAGLTCRQGACTSELGCPASENTCSGSPDDLPNCPGSADPDCHCLTDIEGTPRCVRFGTSASCFNCLSNADCTTPGHICADLASCGCVSGNTCILVMTNCGDQS